MRNYFLAAVLLCGVLSFPAVLAQQRSQQVRPDPWIPDHVQQHFDVVYAEYPDRQLHLDLYRPTMGLTPKPAVVVVHGGGWLNGDKTKFRPFAAALAVRGYIAATIEYRLGGEARFPAAIHDCHAAVRWMRANAQRYGIDPKRIAALGGSAGGHLVGLLATSTDVEPLHGNGGNTQYSSALQAAIVMAGPLELATGPVAEKSRAQPAESNSNKWLGKTIDEDPQLYRLASATTHISAATPPMLFMAGEHDDPQRNIATRRRLRELGITTGIKVYKDGRHGCWNRHPWFGPMMDDMDAFLRQALDWTAERELAPLAEQPWGTILRGHERLELRVERPPAGGAVSLPRFHNPVGQLAMEGHDVKLSLKPEPDIWSLSWRSDASLRPPLQVIVPTVGVPRLASLPPVISLSIDRRNLLGAHDAQTHGSKLRYEPQPHKNTIGYWTDLSDWCQWHLYLDEPGEFDVHIWQGCGQGQGGSEVSVTVGQQELSFIVEDTGHFQNFRQRLIGSVKLPEPGLVSLDIHPRSRAAKAVMDVRQLLLVPTSPTVSTP